MFPTMTKIIVTVSSVSDDEETLTNFLKEGVHIFRINLSHGTSYQHEHSILNIRKCAKEMGIVPVICLDTRGPEVRIEIAERSEIPLKEGDKITFSNVRTSNKIFLPIPDFTKFPLKSKIYLDDAMLAIEVLETSKCECTGRAMNSHRLKNNKKASLPGLVFEDNESEARDKKDFEIILKHKIDVVFASFINCRKEVESLKKLIGSSDVLIFSKIETLRGVENIDEIIEVSDGIMIARGDLGVEMTASKMFSTQKKITIKCREAKKPVICATQMLETMIQNPVPSRAEITDVGNAVFDQFDGLLLSGETAVGKFPTLTVRTMRKIIEDAEAYHFEISDHKNRCPLLGTRIKESCAVIRCPDLATIFGLYSNHFEIPVYFVSKEVQNFRCLHMLRGVIPYEIKEDEDIIKVVDQIKEKFNYKKIYFFEMQGNDEVMSKLRVFK